MPSGIYLILNTVNGKKYIGSSVDLHKRRIQHFSGLNRREHKNAHLQNAWNKYGQKAFVYKPLLICSQDNLLFYEQLCIDHFDSTNLGYNIAPIAGRLAGYKPSREAIEKMAAAKRGSKFSTISLENHQKAMQSESVRKKISDGRKGKGTKPKSPEHVAAVVAANKKHSRHYEFDGKSLTISEWSRLTGVMPDTIAYRIKRGFPLEISLFYKGNLRHAGLI